jgi:hypothetical protein
MMDHGDQVESKWSTDGKNTYEGEHPKDRRSLMIPRDIVHIITFLQEIPGETRTLLALLHFPTGGNKPLHPPSPQQIVPFLLRPLPWISSQGSSHRGVKMFVIGPAGDI